MPYNTIAEDLGRTGLSVRPLFFSVPQIKTTFDDLEIQQSKGNFKSAGIGKDLETNINLETRLNQIYWIDRNHPTPAQSLLWIELDLLKTALNRKLFLGIDSFEGHYTSYSNGGFYKRHLDAFHKNNKRIVSIILYLNSKWIPSHGGELRVYQNLLHTDVNPIGGTLACFMSQESEHEVLQSYSPRYSFTGWFKTQ